MEPITLTPAVAAKFLQHLTGQEKSRSTRQQYWRSAAAFANFAGGQPVTKALVLQYKAALQQRYAARSVNAALAALNCLFSFLGQPGLRCKSVKLQRQIYCPEEKELTRQEYDRLCRAALLQKNTRLYLLLQTVCGTGIRVSELPFITVQAAKSGQATVRCKGKTRTVFLVKPLRQKLLRYAAQQGIVQGKIFVTKTGKPLDRANIWREMKGLCAAAGVNPKKVFPHNLRHLFARVFYGLEKDLAKLADILGHASIETTRIYIISTGSEHRRKLEKMHLIL